MRVDRALWRQVRNPDTESLSIRVSSATSTDAELGAALGRALEQFSETWERVSPLGSSPDGPIPPPVTFSVAVPPDIVLTLDKATDLPRTFDFLIKTLETEAPADTLLSTVPRQKLPGDDGQPIRFCELRVALRCPPPAPPFRQDEFAQQVTLAVGSDWVDKLGASASYYLKAPGSRAVRLVAGTTRAAVAAQRTEDYYGTFTSVLGNRFYRADFYFRDAYFALLVGAIGHEAVATFNPRSAIDELLESLASLEPVTNTAFVHSGHDLAFAGAEAFMDRGLDFLVHRNALSPNHDRILEQYGIVDAQGMVFVRNVPDGIDSSWTQSNFGELTKIASPDFDAWFAGTPSQATIDAGRQSLAPLMRNSVFDDITS